MAPPKKDTVAVGLRLEQSMLDQIDQLRRQDANPPTRPEMIRRIISDWIEKSDGLPPK
ncbi:ribbon-helix-helix domain-containing protein [Pseudoroseicyclus aestuarii]|uniref:ribbon-helix-helix domain-containing protein n=1 Tax=Pseudoroseicyclus aestuarii TaxID=1795041 RepID=UPI000DA1B0F9|nr:ribbon-helix-helix domain-containing protein [Pseudoroseicyclus aestuarii]